MKSYILLLVSLITFVPISSEEESVTNVCLVRYNPTVIKPVKPNIIKPEIKVDSLKMLIDAMIYVESRGNDSIVNSINAAGCLQIRPIMVEDVNRILSKKKSPTIFTLQDRFSRKKSIEMFNVWRNYYHPNSSLEKIARCWNGGGKGHKIKATKIYWKLVKEKLNIKI
jgi:hypothetical protein